MTDLDCDFDHGYKIDAEYNSYSPSITCEVPHRFSEPKLSVFGVRTTCRRKSPTWYLLPAFFSDLATSKPLKNIQRNKVTFLIVFLNNEVGCPVPRWFFRQSPGIIVFSVDYFTKLFCSPFVPRMKRNFVPTGFCCLNKEEDLSAWSSLLPGSHFGQVSARNDCHQGSNWFLRGFTHNLRYSVVSASLHHF